MFDELGFRVLTLEGDAQTLPVVYFDDQPELKGPSSQGAPRAPATLPEQKQTPESAKPN